MGHSYQGRPVSVMELRLPMEAELVSQAKLNVWKPVLSIVGRQHANEVSSTSHILRLAELLATDPRYQHYLRKTNVVIQPVVNPDGAALAYELQKLTPRHCLHAGRYSALGPDVSAGLASDENTLVTQAIVLRDVARRWVADVSLNPHRYPSHEWVHQFANYNPRGFRSYWVPRGWWTNARAVEDPRLKSSGDVVDAMVQYISTEVSRDQESRTTNLHLRPLSAPDDSLAAALVRPRNHQQHGDLQPADRHRRVGRLTAGDGAAHGSTSSRAWASTS